MVDVAFEMKCLDGTVFRPERILAYEINSDVDTPCDSLRLYFECDILNKEIVEITAKQNDMVVFCGYVDVQKDVVDKNGTSFYVFARSKASILTDNEALPRVYYLPTTASLCAINLNGFELENKLPLLSGSTEYEVSKGVSCFRAIDDFVYSICGKHICVSRDGAVQLLDSDGVVNLDSRKMLKTTRTINRGSSLTKICYKLNSEDEYNRFRESVFFKNRGIDRGCYKNLSSVPDWQREITLSNIMQKANSNYYTYRFELKGFVNTSLLDKINVSLARLGNVKNARVVSLCHIFDKNGERTIICASEQFDYEEVSYVD